MSKEPVETEGTEFQSQPKAELQPENIIRLDSRIYSKNHHIRRSSDCLFVQVMKGDRILWECRKAEARLRIAATFTAGAPISKFAQELLQEYGIEDKDIDRWYRLRFVKHMGVQFSFEEEQDYWRIFPLVDQCLSCRCSDSSNQPDDDEPNFERSIGDLIADARAKKNAEAEAAPVVPQPELTPVPPVNPKVEPKGKPKPKPCKPVRNDGWGRD